MNPLPVDADGAVGALGGAAADPLAGAVLADLVVQAVRLRAEALPRAEPAEAGPARPGAGRVRRAGLGLRAAALCVNSIAFKFLGLFSGAFLVVSSGSFCF